MTDQMMTVKDVADLLRVDPESVRRWLRAGKLKAVKLPGEKGGWRVREADLEAFLGVDKPQV